MQMRDALKRSKLEIGATAVSHIFFFFQAEDGIRDLTVTGVQTCALPISPSDGATNPERRPPSPPRPTPEIRSTRADSRLPPAGCPPWLRRPSPRPDRRPAARSEERRVGKECRSRWSAYQ